MKQPQTPFPVTGYYGPAYFCNRESELEQLTRCLRGGQSATLVALRRLGKTALIKHLFHHIQGRYTTIYLDILPTESINELLNGLCTAIVRAHAEKTGFGKKAWDLIRLLRPVISYDALSGQPQVSLRVSSGESRKTLADLITFLGKHTQPVVIALDEFQQILEYPEKQTDAWLRSVVHEMKNVHFIFSGSQQHIMADLFMNPERPFYRSTHFMKIGKLEKSVYRDFIISKFEERGKSVSADVVDSMLQWTELHTYYVQLLCNRVFISSGKKITEDTWREEAGRMLKEQEFVFFGYRGMLTGAQWDLLKAIAREGRVYQPTSSAFITAHSLGNPSTVLRSLRALERMELIYREVDREGLPYYGVYDVLFARWMST